MPFDALHRDVRFLHCLLKEMTEKFIHGMDVEIAPATLEGKVLMFFSAGSAGTRGQPGRNNALSAPLRQTAASACPEKTVRRGETSAPWEGALSPDRRAAGEERIKNDICRSAHARKILVLKCSRTALCVCLSLPGKDKRNQNAEISDDFSVLIQLTGFGSREGD